MASSGSLSNKFMLVQKKISMKKLAIYLAIIFFMLGGTVFMLYKNKNLTTRQSTNVNIPVILDNSALVAPATADNQAATGTGQALNVNNFKQKSGLDLNIFSSDKFKNLQENVFIINQQTEVGKRDPFKPN